MNLFRKYQKALYGAIAVLLILPVSVYAAVHNNGAETPRDTSKNTVADQVYNHKTLKEDIMPNNNSLQDKNTIEITQTNTSDKKNQQQVTVVRDPNSTLDNQSNNKANPSQPKTTPTDKSQLKEDAITVSHPDFVPEVSYPSGDYLLSELGPNFTVKWAPYDWNDGLKLYTGGPINYSVYLQEVGPNLVKIGPKLFEKNMGTNTSYSVPISDLNLQIGHNYITVVTGKKDGLSATSFRVFGVSEEMNPQIYDSVCGTINNTSVGISLPVRFRLNAELHPETVVKYKLELVKYPEGTVISTSYPKTMYGELDTSKIYNLPGVYEVILTATINGTSKTTNVIFNWTTLK